MIGAAPLAALPLGAAIWAHALAAPSVATGAFGVDAPLLRQVHALATPAPVTGAPVVDVVHLGQAYALAAPVVVIGSPSAGPFALRQVHALAAPAAIAMGAPVIGQPAGLADFPDVELHAAIELGRAVTVGLALHSPVQAALAVSRVLRVEISMERGF